MQGSTLVCFQVSNTKQSQWKGEGNVQREDGRGNIQWHHCKCSYRHGEVWEGSLASVTYKLLVGYVE